ncbi:ABC transporter permease [Halanaerobiaceae bacterium Z-7014]|uniref:ABC transporter permease n=1 Tax=Halonatronomonas betaini TaxID=2778430 RepID=A0A931ATV2_9FIRM|nr:ABC transporter permease [Halonatronomonas betaini]
MESTQYLFKKFKVGLKAMLSDKIGVLGISILLIIILLSAISPYIFPLQSRADPTQIFQPPSGENWLGTDHMGRDIWPQIANGGRGLLLLAFITASISVMIGIFLGTAAPLIGGKFDEILLFFADVWLTIPRFPLLVVLSGFFNLTSYVLALVLAILSWAGLFRSIRAEVLSLKEREYVEAAKMLDLSIIHVIFKEITPNMMPFIIMNFTLMMRHAIYAQVGLFFLGLLPLEVNWGVMLNIAWAQGAIYHPDALWFILAPAIAISLLILSLVWINRSLENLFNPVLRTDHDD